MLYIGDIKRFGFKKKYYLVDSVKNTGNWVNKGVLKRSNETIRGYIRQLNHVFNYSSYVDYFNELSRIVLRRVLVGIKSSLDDTKNGYYFVFEDSSTEIRYGLNHLIESHESTDKNIGIVYRHYVDVDGTGVMTCVCYKVKKIFNNKYYKLDLNFGNKYVWTLAYRFSGLYFKDNNFYCRIDNGIKVNTMYINLFNFDDFKIVNVL